MTLKVCEAFKDVENHLPDTYSFNRNKVSTAIRTYCKFNIKTWTGECNTIGEVVSAVTMLLLNKLLVLNTNLESENKNNEYITYVMLWLSNKMKLLNNRTYGAISEFYVTFIKKGEHYKKYLDKINSKKTIMRIKIEEMRKLYGLLNELCIAITKHTTDPSNCSNFSKFVNNWIKLYIQFVLKKIKFFEDEYYCDVLMTLKNAYEKFKKDNDTKKNFPEIIEIEGMNNCKKLTEEATRSWKVINVVVQDAPNVKKKLEEGKDTSKHIDFKNIFEFYGSFFSMFTNNVKDLYEKALPTLKDFYDKLKNSADNTISYVNELKKTIETLILDNCMPEKKETGSESSSPSSSTEHTRTSQSSSDLSENGGSDKKCYEASQILSSNP
ncbi:hypothetical protein YYC_05920, partial [Plasmodium yoelii 17X]